MHFYTLLTKLGEQKIAQAALNKNTIELNTLVVGDGNGVVPAPNAEQTSLIHQVYEVSLSELTQDETNKNWLVTTAHIPANEGNFWIREVGIKDSDGDLIAVGNYPETYKPILENGVAKDLLIKLMVAVTSMENITLTADSKELMATKEYVDNALVSQFTGFKNLLINGDFSVWQRGESFTKKLGYTADRWMTGYHTGGVDLTFEKVSANHPEIFSNAVKITSSLPTGADARQWFGQKFEHDMQKMSDGSKRTLTLSFWAKGDDCLEKVYRGSTEGEPISLTPEWKKYSVTFSDNMGMPAIYFLFKNDMKVNMQISMVQLEVGDKATNFEYRPISLEKMMCERYYQEKEWGFTWYLSSASPATKNQFLPLRTSMRVTPSCEISVNSSYGVISSYGSNGISPNDLNVWVTVSANGNYRQFFTIKCDAEIY